MLRKGDLSGLARVAGAGVAPRAAPFGSCRAGAVQQLQSFFSALSSTLVKRARRRTPQLIAFRSTLTLSHPPPSCPAGSGTAGPRRPPPPPPSLTHTHTHTHHPTPPLQGNLAALYDSMPKAAVLVDLTPGGEPDMGSARRVLAADVAPGDLMLVKPGEQARRCAVLWVEACTGLYCVCVPGLRAWSCRPVDPTPRRGHQGGARVAAWCGAQQLCAGSLSLLPSHRARGEQATAGKSRPAFARTAFACTPRPPHVRCLWSRGLSGRCRWTASSCMAAPWCPRST